MAGTWLAYFENTGIQDGNGVVQRKQIAPREQLGHRQAILGRYAWQGEGYLMRVEQLSESESS